MSLAFAVPRFALWHDSLWDTILDLSALLDDGTWALVGGQAVVAHALAHRVSDARLNRDPDPVGRIVTVASALPTVRKSFQYLGFEPDTAPGTTLGFTRAADAAGSEPQHWQVHVVGKTHLPGGDQALARRIPYRVTKGLRTPAVPVPDVLSTIVYEANRFADDTADPFVHARDIAFLVALLDDIGHQAERLTPTDRRALVVVDEAVGDAHHSVWASAPTGRDAHAAWRRLLEP